MMKRNIVIVLMVTGLFWSCQNDDDQSPQPPEFGIAGETLNTMSTYEQTVFNGGSNGDINVYNPMDKTLLLQSFKNGKDDSEGFWTIRINGVDIENQKLPYALTGVEGTITWVDESVKNLQAQCAAPDVLCFYSGVGVDEVKITIDSVDDSVITGKFEGKLYHITVNPSVIRDTDDMVEIVKGAFTIKFQTK
ncbi:hypothetical protein [Allomuricauda sp. SCSIO 65647]|uniref:hypothetical protein n=1 Tax=Allomuricauda sp. SCSIO 65647 TaxID=2908843 RepID=UPI001F449EDD|nr:hypothetical protein [Muricauda sp. SCSIO 65647]UJH67795.1 hypothetical protein L0P89_00915 [Muricauda sp. SCSIO 65647]